MSETKFGPKGQVPNRTHIIICSNHDQPVKLGIGDRRYFVLNVDDAMAQNKAWFGPLYDDLEAGGYGEFLDFLLKIDLAGWHPRQMPRTEEANELIRASSDSIMQWMLCCVDDETGSSTTVKPSGTYPTTDLYSKYLKFCNEVKDHHPINRVLFGKRLKALFGDRQNIPSPSSKSRPKGYLVPDEDAWRRKIDKYLRIK
jgi:hypothetical protein